MEKWNYFELVLYLDNVFDNINYNVICVKYVRTIELSMLCLALESHDL